MSMSRPNSGAVQCRPNAVLAFLNSTGTHGPHLPADAMPARRERYIRQCRVGSTAEVMSTPPEERRPLWASWVQVDD
jgi:hypothetical protein